MSLKSVGPTEARIFILLMRWWKWTETALEERLKGDAAKVRKAGGMGRAASG
jgi:hypothetical protein